MAVCELAPLGFVESSSLENLANLVTSKMIVERPPSQGTSYEDQVRTWENTIEKAAQQDSALFMIRQAKSRTMRHKILPNITVVDNSFFNTPCEFSTTVCVLRMKTGRSSSKPLLLWIQGGPWKSSLFSQFLENGPLGINATGSLYYRNHSLLRDFNLIYLDHPVGSGYSFDDNDRYPGTLDEASEQALTFLKRFLRLFPEYKRKEFYIAGESYGARSSVGVAYKVLKKHKQIDLKLKGAMLGVGFVFPLLELLNSTDYLFYSGLLGDFGRRTFAGWFDMIKGLVDQKHYSKATEDLNRIVLNQAPPGNMTVFEYLTGFRHHGSIARPQEPDEVEWYMEYANSENFKKIIHVNVSRVLDGCRPLLTKELINGDFYVDVKKKLEYVLNSTHVLFYTAQYDAVFPEINIESCFQKLRWYASHHFLKVKRKPWFVQGNRSLPLLGYERITGTLLYTNILWGGHDVSLDRSVAMSELYHRFLRLSREGKLLRTDLPS
nr:venom serine carboxypeptidase-like [Rhipicephalus microplus]